MNTTVATESTDVTDSVTPLTEWLARHEHLRNTTAYDRVQSRLNALRPVSSLPVLDTPA